MTLRLLLAALLVCSAAIAQPRTRRATAKPPAFDGRAALELTARAVAFGQRPPGSAANRKLRSFIRTELAGCGCEVTEDAFIADTPVGRVPMRNIIALFRGTSGRAVVISGHYDTKSIPGVNFVGANDGGSSTGFLLELARVLPQIPHKNEILLVWFDGEEAFGDWSDVNGAYGSRHLAAKWAASGMLSRVKAFINVDMIGDKDLDLLNDTASSARLRQLIWSIAGQLGLRRFFLEDPGYIADDHTPFLQQGVNAVDLIDFTYGPGNAWWHTAQDTLDKLSAESFQVVGDVVLQTIQALE